MEKGYQFPEKEIFPQNSPESQPLREKEPHGQNIKVEVNLIRHSERERYKTWKNTPLTMNGFLDCVKLGQSLEKKDLIVAGASPADRTLETAQEIIDYSPTENKKMVVYEELASRSSPEFIEQVEDHVKRSWQEKYNCPPPENLELCCTVFGIDFYLKYGDKRPDNQTYSPIEAAANVALALNDIIANVDNMPSNTDMDSFFVSHDYMVAAFLQQVIMQELENSGKKTGFDSLAELGNFTINFLEGPKIIIKNDDQGKKTVELFFRQKKYGMDMERFSRLVKMGQEFKKERSKNKILNNLKPPRSSAELRN